MDEGTERRPETAIAVRPIPKIDKDIDAVRKALRRTASIDASLTPQEWAAVLDANPELRDRERELFRERGFAQLERDRREYERAMRVPAAPRRKKCPTCGRTA